MYNVKVQRFNDEVQLSLYRYGISTREKKDNDKNVIKSDKQRNKTIKQSNKAIIENKIRSTRRTKQSIYNISRANDWKYFATFTFENNRYDYEECKKRLRYYLRNTRQRYCDDLEYLVVPELHKDGAIHFHALLMGSIEELMCESFEKDKMMLKNYKHGISQIEPIKDANRVAMYITKYITKELLSNVQNAQRYFCSNGVNRAEEKTYYVNDLNDWEFIENNFSDFDISYIKNCENKGYKVSYIQLKMKNYEKQQKNC